MPSERARLDHRLACSADGSSMISASGADVPRNNSSPPCRTSKPRAAAVAGFHRTANGHRWDHAEGARNRPAAHQMSKANRRTGGRAKQHANHAYTPAAHVGRARHGHRPAVNRVGNHGVSGTLKLADSGLFLAVRHVRAASSDRCRRDICAFRLCVIGENVATVPIEER